ncbi:DNA topoisomerase I, mitochondrial isoform X2 [Hoplias malabaricus]
MKVKDEKERDDRGRRKSTHHLEKHGHRHRKKQKSKSKDQEKSSEINGMHHRLSTKHPSSPSSEKLQKESKIMSSEKVESDSGNSGSGADDMDVDTKRSFEKSGQSLNGNNMATVKQHGKSGTEEYTRGHKEMTEETSKHKTTSKHRKDNVKKEKDTDKEVPKRGSETGHNNKAKDGSTGDKQHVNVTRPDHATSLTAVKGEELPICDGGQVHCATEVKKGEQSLKKAETIQSDSIKKKEKQDRERKRKSSGTEQDEDKANKKRKDDKKKKDEKEKKEVKKAEEEASKWKWWEEGKPTDGHKWRTLVHNGPLFPPEYEPLPSNVPFLYNGEPVKLSLATEEVASFYAKMLDHEYTTKESFQNNFFTDWKEVMTESERQVIKTLSKCDFSNIHKYFMEKAEEKKNMTKEEKQVLKDEANKLTEEYGYCLLDGHKEKIGNFRVEPPGLFRGRGEHPKMGKLKKRVQPEDIIINCSKDGKIPEPPAGHRWKKVQHDNTVTWLASWVENIHGNIKYIMLNPSSKLKGEKDWQKYETARKLKLRVDSIRREYQNSWTSREMKQRQRGVALYFIDKLALRAGNEKDDDTADTVGCCSLRVEHVKLHRHLDGQEYVVEFDFLGKDSIRYYNKVPVEKQVYKNLKRFMECKNPEDDLFDRISTSYLNKKLNEAMTGLTAKVFRTFNASTTLQDQLNKLTTDDMTVEEKILAYNRANRAVAILCNHQRAAPKTFEKSMQLLQEKIKKKKEEVAKAKKELKQAKEEQRAGPSKSSSKLVEKKEKAVKRLLEQLKKLLLQETDREENKVIALGTSKLNYLDPRITVA